MVVGVLMDSFWQELLEKLKQKIGPSGFDTFAKSVKPRSLEDGVLKLSFPNTATLLWYNARCEKLLQEIFVNDFQQNIVIDGIVDTSAEMVSEPVRAPAVGTNNHSPLQPAGQFTAFNPQYTFETFVVGNSNDFAYKAAIAVAENPGKMYNPLLTIGGSGLGKTHLMHAIAQRALQKNPRAKIVYITAKDFVDEVVNALMDASGRQENMNRIHEKYRTTDILMLDDIQSFAGKETCQEEFFYAFNALHSANKQIVLNSDRAPHDIKTLEDRLLTRLKWGLTTIIDPPNTETRIAILRHKAAELNAQMPDEVIEYIAKLFSSSVRELEGAVRNVVTACSFKNEPISLTSAMEILKNLNTQPRQPYVTPGIILQVVSEKMNIDINDFIAKGRKQDIAGARQLVMYLARKLTDATNEKIGRILGNRDHTTVMHGVEKISDSIRTDQTLLDLVMNLEKEIFTRAAA